MNKRLSVTGACSFAFGNLIQFMHAQRALLASFGRDDDLSTLT